MRATLMLLLCASSLVGCWLVTDEQPVDAPRDIWSGGGDDPLGPACNPLAPPGQQGCLTGQKCTWLTVQETPDELGKLACVPDGTVELDGACMTGPAGETTGFDDCRAGLHCIAGVCADVCGFDASANAGCPSGFHCTRYDDLFANGEDDPIAGICEPGCDPLTQIRVGTDPPSDCGEGQGCYLLASQTTTIAVCARAGTVGHGDDLPGVAFANACVPGAQPRRKDQTSQTVQCGGLCNVVDVSMGLNEASEGGEVTPSLTDKDSCQSSWSAAPPDDALAGESCRYWWAREPFDAVSPYSNSVGWCFRHAVFEYDSNGDMTNDTLFPRCTATTASDLLPPVATPPVPDNHYFWCVATPPPMLAGAMRNIKALHARMEPRLDRLAGR